MGETYGGGIDRQHEAALGTRLTFVRENHELARHELAAVIVAHGAGDEQQLAFLDLALEERLTRPGTLERATAAVVAEDRPEYPESLRVGSTPVLTTRPTHVASWPTCALCRGVTVVASRYRWGAWYNGSPTLRIPSRASASARFGPTPFRYFTDVLSCRVTRR